MRAEPTDRAEATRRAVAGLGLLALALGLRAALSTLNGALHAWLVSGLLDGGGEELRGAIGPLSQGVFLGTLVAGAMLVLGVRALGAAGPATARARARLAFWAFLAGLALDLVQYGFSLAPLGLEPQVRGWIFGGLSGAGLLADGIAWGAFFLAATGLYASLPGGDARGRLALAVGATALWLLFWLVQMVVPALGGLLFEHPWIQFGVRAGLHLAQAGAVVWLALDLRKLLPLAGTPGEGQAAGLRVDLGPEAARVVGGLRAYRAWLLVKLAVLVLGYGLILALAFGEARESARGVLFGVALLGLVPACGMLWGLWQYLAVPEESGARGGAQAALGVACLGFLADLGGVWLASRLLGDDYRAMLQAAELSPWFEGGAQALGLVGLLCVLSSFRQLAFHLRAEPLGRRAGGLMGLAAVVVVAALGLRVGLLRGALPAMLGLVLAGAALIAAVVLVVLFVQLVGRLADAAEVRPADHPPEYTI